MLAFLQNLSPVQLLFAMIALAIVILPFWKIIQRIGYSPWLSFLAIIPFGIFILLYVIAFAPWPTEGQRTR